MALSLTVNTNSTASRTVTSSRSGQNDRLVRMDNAWSVVVYDPDGTGLYAKVITHPSGGAGALTTETTIYSGDINSGGTPQNPGRLSASKVGWVRWKVTGFGLTMFNASSSGIGTVGSEQTIGANETGASFHGGLYRLTDSIALFIYNQGAPGPIRAAHVDHSPGLTVASSPNYVQLVTSGYLQCCAPIDSTHLLMVWWDTTTLKAAIVTDSGGTINIGTATTLLTGGAVYAGHAYPTLDGSGCHPIVDGSSYLVAVPSGSSPNQKLYLWVINVSGGSITSATADPSNGTPNYSGSFTFTLRGAQFLGMATAAAGGPESTSSAINNIWPLDSSHQLGTSLGSLSSITETTGWIRSFDADDRVVSFAGTHTDGGGIVRALEQTINGLPRPGGWTVGAIAMSA